MMPSEAELTTGFTIVKKQGDAKNVISGDENIKL